MILKTRIPREERETYYNISDLEPDVLACSSIPKDIRKMKKQGWEVVREDTYEDGTVAEATLKAPKRAISIRAVSSLNKKLKSDSDDDMDDEWEDDSFDDDSSIEVGV